MKLEEWQRVMLQVLLQSWGLSAEASHVKATFLAKMFEDWSREAR